MAFEETAEELTTNVASLGFDLDELVERQKLAIDYVHIERSEIEETGEYDLEGLFVRLGHAIDSIGAKRVVLDTIEALFAGLLQRSHPARRTAAAVPLAEGQGASPPSSPASAASGPLTRHGLEEYVSDCVIVLDHRVDQQISTRRLRIVKYRGSPHGTNEYPFLIDEQGISVLPITSLRPRPRGLQRAGLQRRPAPGRHAGGGGYYRGSSVLVSGTAGTGKSEPGRPFRRCRLPSAASGACISPSRNRPPDHPQHALHRHRPGAVRA